MTVECLTTNWTAILYHFSKAQGPPWRRGLNDCNRFEEIGAKICHECCIYKLMSSCDCLNKMCTRPIQSAFYMEWEESRVSTTNWGTMNSWRLLWDGELIFLKSVIPGKSTIFQSMALYLEVYRNHKLNLMSHLRKDTKLREEWIWGD